MLTLTACRVDLEGFVGGASAVPLTALSIPKECSADAPGCDPTGTLSRVLDPLRPCFTAPTFETFTVLVAGLVAQPVARTVCGMLTGAGLARVWHHARAHRFFSAARWCPHQVGLVVAQLVVTHLLPAGAPVTIAVDDTLFRRRGRTVHAVGWFHDGSATGQVKLGFDNNWVVAAIIVTLPFVSRPVALPVLAALAVKNGDRSKPERSRIRLFWIGCGTASETNASWLW